MRLVLSQKFEKAYRKLDATIQKRVDRALTKLIEEPRRKGVNLEPVTAQSGVYTARVGRNYRLLLKELEPDQEFPEIRRFLVVGVAPHDDTYAKRR